MVAAPLDKQEEEEDRKVCQIVQRWLDQHSSGRAIVYANSIERVERLGQAMGCGHYHAKSGTSEKKATRLRAWREKGALIVATNALGLGVDVPDVRLVVHACPRQGGETWRAVKGNREFMIGGIFTKRRFSKHAGCYWCGLPQEVCDRWEAMDDDGGRFRLVRGKRCQYEGVMTKVCAGAYTSYLE